jgi:pyrroloquinoline quinone (PQQ) biosynthesis protein C
MEDDVLLPDPRGPLSNQVIDALAGSASAGPFPAQPTDLPEDVIHHDDVQLALWVLYELHYEGFDGVDEEWEWDSRVVAFQARLEEAFLAALHAMAPVPDTDPQAPLHERIEAVTELAPSSGMSRFMQREATPEQFREYLRIKSVYHLKESDPHSFVLPRLRGRPKVRLAELQYDEYGGGRTDRHHQTLFGNTLRAAGLDDTYGAHLDVVPAVTLAVNNAMSMFGIHRRHRGAAMGHLAAFEATSSIPCRRVAQGVRRIGLPEAAADYFDEHVEADAVHEQLAMREICGALAAEDPSLTDSILFGSWVCCYLDYLDGVELVGRWNAGASALRPSAPGRVPSQRRGIGREMVGAA